MSYTSPCISCYYRNETVLEPVIYPAAGATATAALINKYSTPFVQSDLRILKCWGIIKHINI